MWKNSLKALGLKLDARDDSTSSQPKGTITKQNPKGGKKVAKGSTVSVWFSTGPQAVSVPDVSGKTQEEAKGILEAAGFKIGNVMTVDSASIEKRQGGEHQIRPRIRSRPRAPSSRCIFRPV